jgi:replicative DNA helicase
MTRGGIKSLAYSPPSELARMEQGILGAILSGEDVPAFFDSRMFYNGRHSIIYKAARDLQDRGISPDILSVTKRLSETGQIDSVGGPVYVSSLTNYVPLKSSIAYYAETITKEYEKRKAQIALLKALEEMGKPYEEASLVIQNVVSELLEIEKNAGKKTGWTAAELKTHEFPDVQWIVPDLVAAGLSALCGAQR